MLCVLLFDIQVPRIYGSGKGKSIVQNNRTILFMQEWLWPTAPRRPRSLLNTYHIKFSIGSVLVPRLYHTCTAKTINKLCDLSGYDMRLVRAAVQTCGQ